MQILGVISFIIIILLKSSFMFYRKLFLDKGDYSENVHVIFCCNK